MLSLQIFSYVKHGSQIFYLSMRGKHIFKAPPFSLSQLEQHLKSTVQYERGFVVLNKPVGISYGSGLVGADSLNPGRDVCIKNALPAIKEHLNVKELFSVKIPERNVSGVTIFSDNEKTLQEVHKWNRVMRERRDTPDIYLAVVIGAPIKHTGYFNGIVTLKDKNNFKRVVLTEEIPRNAVKRGDAKRVTFNYRTLAANRQASLVEIESNRVKWNCVRAFLATQTLSPVLGDSLYGTFVKRIMGVPVPVDIFSKPLLEQQKLPEDIIKSLDLIGRKDVIIPLHLHLSHVTLMIDKKESVEFTTTVPDTFQWTLDQLNLSKQTRVALSAS